MSTIPPMTHPWSAHWEQPTVNGILIDDAHALMSAEDFDKLGEYSCSIPTGVYEGKMWKRREPYGPVTPSTAWYLMWYGPSNDPEKCSINHRRILFPE